MRRNDIEDGLKPDANRVEGAELRKARKSIRLLEQENEALRRAAAYLSKTNLTEKALPAVTELATD